MGAILRKYGVATHLYLPVVKRGVVDYAVGADWTPAAGDVKISKDGGAAANIGTLPSAIAMGNTAMWDFTLTATEMQAAKIVITVADSATKVVEDQFIIVDTYGDASAEHAFDLDTATQSVNVASGGITSASYAAGAITASAIAADAIGASELAADAVTEIQSGLATAAALATVQADTDDIQTRLPAALVGGRMDSSVGAVANNAITAASIATDAIDNDAIAANAVTEIQSGLATASALATAQSDLDDLQTRVPAALVGGRMDSSVGAVAVNAITAASIATDAIDADALAADAVAEIQAGSSAPSAAVVADAVWDEARAGHVAAGSFGEGVASVQGNMTGSVGSVTGAVGSVAGNVGGSVGSVAAGGITAASIATDAVDSDAIAASAVTEIQAGLATAAAQTALAASVAAVQADTDDLQARVPAALVGGRMDSSVGAMAAGVVTAAAVATGAVDADALATDAVNEIVTGILAGALTELAAEPGAAPSVGGALQWLYQAARDKVATDGNAGTVKVHNDAGAAIATALVTDVGGVTTRNKFA